MVSTRSQTSKSKVTELIEIDYNSDNDSEASFPECNARPTTLVEQTCKISKAIMKESELTKSS